MELYCRLILIFGMKCTGEVGDLETEASASAESPLGYHSFIIGILTCSRYPGKGHCQAGSLTGAVASKRVTEAFKGWLSMDGNHA